MSRTHKIVLPFILVTFITAVCWSACRAIPVPDPPAPAVEPRDPKLGPLSHTMDAPLENEGPSRP